jgi:hypothetical protein
MSFFLVVKENEWGEYSIRDSIDTRLHTTSGQAYNQIDKLQPMFNERLIVVGN